MTFDMLCSDSLVPLLSLLIFVQECTFFLFAIHVLVKKYDNNYLLHFFFFCLVWIMAIFFGMTSLSIPARVFVLVLFLFLWMSFYKIPWIKKMLVFSVVLFLTAIGQIIPWIVLFSMYHGTANALVENPGTAIILWIQAFGRAISFFLLSLLRKSHLQDIDFLPKKLNFFIFFLVLGSGICIYALSSVYYLTDSFSSRLWVSFTLLFLIAVNIIFLSFYGRIYEDFVKNENLAAIQLYKNLNLQHIEKIKEENKKTSKLWHDMKGYLGVMENLCQHSSTGNPKEIKEQLLEEIRQKLKEAGELLHTGHEVVDAILNDKKEKAKKLGIQDFQVSAMVKETLPLPASDLCSLLINTLDNAIEAAINLPSPGFIRLTLLQRENLLYYSISNSYMDEESLNKEKNDIGKSKEFFNKKINLSKGYGLIILGEMVDRNQGLLEILKEEGVYSLKVILPLFF